MAHYIEGIEDKEALRNDFNKNFEGALRAQQRLKTISAGQFQVATYENPLACVSSLLRRNGLELNSLSTIVADFVMVNERSGQGSAKIPSLYVLADNFAKDPSTFERVPLIIVYSGKPASEIITDPSFERWVKFAEKNPANTPAIGYRGKTGDLQDDVIDLFRLVKRGDDAIRTSSLEEYRAQLHQEARTARYLLKNLQ